MTPALRARLEQLIEKFRVQSKESSADGDYCCGLTRKHDADDLDHVLASLDAPQEPQAAKDTQLIADILDDYRDDMTKESCDECPQCGPMFMCRFHSVLSALSRDTWTNAALERSRQPPAVAPREEQP